MSRIKRARPALVVVLALIAAVAGTAIASSGPDANTSASAKKTAQKALAKAKKALAKAKQAEKQEGPKGEKGDQGDQGLAGPQGTAGAPDPGIQLARVTGLPTDDSVVYAAPSGTSTPDTDREGVAAALPAGDPVDPADLSVVLSEAPGAGNSRTVQLAWITPGSGQNLNPSCVISGDDTACGFAGSAPSSNNALLAIRFSGTGTPAAAEAAVGYRLVPE